MKLFVEDNQIDLYDPKDAVIPMTYSVKEMQNPENIKGSRSITLKVPNTKNNFNNLGNPLGVNADDNKIKKAYLYDGGVVWTGRCEVVERTSKEFKLALIGNNAEWFSDAKATNLRDLELGAYTFNAINMYTSWITSDSIVYYPVIDYGHLADRDYDYDIPIEEIRPAVRVKPLLEKVFGDFGYSIDWRGTLKDLSWVIPWTGKEILPTDAYSADRGGDASGGGNSAWDYTRNPVPLGTIDNDPSSAMSIVNGGAFYDPVFPNGKMTVSYTGQVLVPAHGTGDQIFFYIVEDYGGSNTVLTDTTWTLDIPANPFPKLHDIEFTTPEFEVQSGYDYGLMIITANASPPGGNFTFYNGDISFRVTEISWGDGFEFNLESILPKMKVIDLVKTINTLYNAVWETSEGKITVMPKSEWYDIATDDWTRKTDTTKAHIWKPLIRERLVDFAWAEDDNDLNLKLFADTQKRGFGDKEVELENKNNSGTKDMHLPFAATWMGNFAGAEIPLLYKDDDREQGQDNYQVSKYDHKPRFLLEYQTYLGPFTIEGVGYGFNFPTAVFIRRNSDFTTPNLAFGTEGRFGDQAGLVDRYYTDQIFSWNNEKMFEGYLRVTPTDIRLLDFSRPKVIQVENGTRRIYLEEISKYKNGVEGSTKVKAYG